MIEFERRATGTVANPDVGSDVLFLDNDGVFYTKNSAGVLTVLGKGIVSIVKTGTVGLVDTYTITFSGGATQDYTVTNGDDGRSIVSVERTSGTGAPGTTDTYTITYSEAPLTSTFTVYNGANGLDGNGQPAQNAPTSIDPDDASSIGTRTAFYALEDHQHAIVAASAVGLNGGSANGEGTASSFARSDHTHAVANGGTPSTIQPDAAANQGASTSLARSDHTHAIAADVPVALGASASEGTSNSFARADHVHPFPSATQVGVQSFANIAVGGQTTVAADSATDTLTIVGSGSVTVTTDAANDTITIAGAVAAPQNCFAVVSGNTGVATADTPADTIAITGGTGISTTATDTPDGLVITNTGVTSVNGQTGAVTVPVLTAVTRTAPTASASTVLTTIQSYPLATGEVTAGSEYEFYASLRVINTTTATNAVITLSVGATNVLVLTQAIGTTAAAAPGAAVEIYGRITFYSATSAEAYIRASKQAAVAFDAVANTSASVTVAAAAATTIDLKFNTSGATSTHIARIATIRKVR